jgi:hypothetical protein
MKKCCTGVHRFKGRKRQFCHWRTGRSLHSHTMHSKEYLGRLPGYIAKFPIGGTSWSAKFGLGEFGRRHWMMRVFIEQDGKAAPLSEFTETRFHRVIEKFRWVIGLVANPFVRPALRLPFLGYEEGGL